MADSAAVSVLARLPPVRSGKDAWLAASRGLVASGAVEEAELVLSTLAQAHDRDVPLRVLLAALALRTGRWTEALAAARRAIWPGAGGDASAAGSRAGKAWARFPCGCSGSLLRCRRIPPLNTPIARRQAVALAEGGGTPLARLQAAVALALALGHVARHTPVMAPSERSKCRAEARAALEPLVGVKRGGKGAAAQGGDGGAAAAAEAAAAPPAPGGAGGGAAAAAADDAGAALPAFRAEAQYYLAVLYAEGGHFGASADAARAALAACPPAGAAAPPLSPLLRPAVLGLLALLLSPHQPRPALQLADAAVACCPATGSADAADAGGGGGGAAGGGGLRVGHARGLDVVLLRTRAALLLSVGETGAALEALALAKQRLSAARRGAADERVARQYGLMEAQARGGEGAWGAAVCDGHARGLQPCCWPRGAVPQERCPGSADLARTAA
jgi:hypothetical protein